MAVQFNLRQNQTLLFPIVATFDLYKSFTNNLVDDQNYITVDISTCAIWENFAKALISENGNIAQKYEKLLLCKGYHILKYLYQSYKQLSIGKVLPPQMVPICSLAHGL